MNFKNLPPLHTHMPELAGTFCGIVGGPVRNPKSKEVSHD